MSGAHDWINGECRACHQSQDNIHTTDCPEQDMRRLHVLLEAVQGGHLDYQDGDWLPVTPKPTPPPPAPSELLLKLTEALAAWQRADDFAAQYATIPHMRRTVAEHYEQAQRQRVEVMALMRQHYEPTK
jgi:hypothetical protein